LCCHTADCSVQCAQRLTVVSMTLVARARFVQSPYSPPPVFSTHFLHFGDALWYTRRSATSSLFSPKSPADKCVGFVSRHLNSPVIGSNLQWPRCLGSLLSQTKTKMKARSQLQGALHTHADVAYQFDVLTFNQGRRLSSTFCTITAAGRRRSRSKRPL
jgi:hypothetical protein